MSGLIEKLQRSTLGLLLLLTSLWSSQVLADDQVIAASLDVAAEPRIEAVAADPAWYRLLHMDADGISSVDDRRFFLAQSADDGSADNDHAVKGHTDNEQADNDHADNNNKDIEAVSAAQELIATLAAMRLAGPVGNDHPRCRFPARYLWLSQQGLLNGSATDLAGCDDYQSWRQQVNASSVSLIFPSAYLNSPSSMYGHTFLRFDSADADSGSLWLSWALNFGANVNMDDNTFAYAYKGLVGGYPGQFNVMPYFDKIKEYNRMENRDMWEYRLNLSEAEVDQMLTHIWELKDINFDYYFFDENCSYRLLELIDLVRPEARLTEPFEYAAIPADTVRAVIDADMVTSRFYRPSHRNRFYQELAQLNPQQRARLQALSVDDNQQAIEQLQQLPAEQRKATAEAAYSLTRLRENGQVRDPKTSRASYRLLKSISQQPDLGVADQARTLLEDPVDGHLSSTTGLALGDDDRGSFAQLHYRPAYHDLLDPTAGYPPGSLLQMMALDLRAYDDGSAQLQQLDLIRIRSFSPRDAFFQPFSWQLAVGLDQVQSDYAERGDQTEDHLAGHASAGGGVSYALADSLLFYALATVRAELNSQLDNDAALAAGINPGLLLSLPSRSLQLKLEGRHDQLTEGFSRSQLQLAGQYQLSPQRGLRLSMEQRWLDGNNSDQQLKLEYRVYH
ncbi:MAG: DUF4105 domain-containing protein [Motiliproteus sp.]